MSKGKDWYWDNQVKDFIKNLLGNPDNIIVDASCRNNELLKNAINNFLKEESKQHLFLPLCVNSLTKNFLLSNENHWVGIHLQKDSGNFVCNYFDPMGYAISEHIKEIFSNNKTLLIEPRIMVQYTTANKNKEGEIIELDGNTDDCGPMLSYLMAMSYYNKVDEVFNELNIEESNLLGVILRAGYNQKMSLDQVQGFIPAIKDVCNSTTNNNSQSSQKGNSPNIQENNSLETKEDTNNIGRALLSDKLSVLQKIQIATEFAKDTNYKINSYLNTKGMDCITPSEIGGITLLHKIIFIAASMTKPSKEETKAISKFFKTLQKRNNEAEDKDLFNPDYPTMNPNSFKYESTKKTVYKFEAKAQFSYPSTPKTKRYFEQEMDFYRDESSKVETDYHMISTGLLIDKISFGSQKLKTLCKKCFNTLKSDYELRQFEDSSGDSEEVGSTANEYKEHLIKIDQFINKSIEGNTLEDKTNQKVNDSRTFDHYNKSFGFIPNQMNNLFDEQFVPRQEEWSKLNSTGEDILYDLNDSVIVPLFHGVPFMSSQYTNYERREVVRKFIKINEKLFAKSELEEEEEILIDIHSRTATASVGIQSLYDMINSNIEQLKKLKNIDDSLHSYFSKYEPNQSAPISGVNFNNAMQTYVFKFAAGKTKEFWNNMKEDNIFKEFPSDNVVKYRFPVIATSKTPDHSTKFAIGNNVEENVRGEMSMKPEYIEGKPTHRAAGLLYVTLHKLGDLKEAFKNSTAIDINRALNLKQMKFENVLDKNNLQNQVECDFLGRMTGEVVAVIPIIYPHIRKDGAFKYYHQAIWGINPKSHTKMITNPVKILEDLQNSPNPNVNNTASFGKIMMPSIVDLANGVVLAITKSQQKFLCSITENNDLVPYNLKFDYDKKKTTSLSYMHRELTKSTKATQSSEKNWENSVEKAQRKKIDESTYQSPYQPPKSLIKSDEDLEDNLALDNMSLDDNRVVRKFNFSNKNEEDNNPEGNALSSHEHASYWYSYTQRAMIKLLQLRVKHEDLKDVEIVQIGSVFKGDEKTANIIVEQISSILNISAETTLLIPVNLYNKHWVGLVTEKDASEQKITINYMDSEQQSMPKQLILALQQALSNSNENYEINIEEAVVELQKYNNCGSETIENMVAYFTNEKFSQEEAVEAHSILLEQFLLGNTESNALN